MISKAVYMLVAPDGAVHTSFFFRRRLADEARKRLASWGRGYWKVVRFVPAAKGGA